MVHDERDAKVIVKVDHRRRNAHVHTRARDFSHSRLDICLAPALLRHH